MKKIFTLFGCLLLLGTLTAFAADELTLYVEDYNGNDVADSFDTELDKDADGNLVIVDFCSAGAPVAFTFAEPEVKAYANIELKGNLDTADTYPYLLTSDGDYLTCCFTNLNGKEGKTYMYYPYVATGSYSYVYRYDMSDPDNYYEYYGCLCISGFDEDGKATDWYYISFYFNIPDAGVDAIEVDPSTVKVEYFNLNGQRVEAPSTGLYIRKQGKETSKVVVR